MVKNTNMKHIFEKLKKVLKIGNIIYFVEDTGYNDAQLLIINMSLPLNDNTTQMLTLDGLNYISDIKIDEINKDIYIISGSLNSELYKLDYSFNKQRLNNNCDIDFLKFPPEWGVITNIQLDINTGYIYAIPSTKYSFQGIVRINMKNMEIDMDSYKIFIKIIEHEHYSYYHHLINTNISSINFDTGELLLFSNQNSWHSYYIKYNLFGCATGRGFNNSIGFCKICPPGKFSNVIGDECKDCLAGYANELYESTYCDKCEMGKYTTGIHTIECIDCPVGYYIESEGSDKCIHCNAGKYSLITSSTSKDNCLECVNGKISENGENECHFCNIGKWSKNRIKCIECSQGKYSNSFGLIADDECKLCPIGKYNDDKGLKNEQHCKICPNGKIGIIEGAKSNTSHFSEVGKYKNSLMFAKNVPMVGFPIMKIITQYV